MEDGVSRLYSETSYLLAYTLLCQEVSVSLLPLVMVQMLLGLPCVSNNLCRLWRQFPLNTKGFRGPETRGR
jgi:hypothetical protein